jgi:ribosomal protein L9
LLPQQKVLLYNHNNLLWVEKQRVKEEQKNLLLEEKAQEIYKKINNFTLNFTLKKDEKGEPFGSVGFREILQELEKSGFLLEKSQLLEFHSLNKLGENTVRVKLSSEIIANLKITIK